MNIRRQRFLTEDTYIGTLTETLSINRYIYGNDNPLKFNDPSGFISNVIMSSASKAGPGVGCGGGSQGLVSNGMILTSSTLSYGPRIDGNIQQTFKDTIIQGFNGTEIQVLNQDLLNQRIDAMIEYAKVQANDPNWWEKNYENIGKNDVEEGHKWVDNDVIYNDWYYGSKKVTGENGSWCSVFVTYNIIQAGLADKGIDGEVVEPATAIFPSYEEAKSNNFQRSVELKKWYENQNRYHTIEEVKNGTYVPKKGDVFIRKDEQHSGIIMEDYIIGSTRVQTVEGNTTPIKDDANGFRVLVRDRTINSIAGFGDNMYKGGMIQ